MLNNNGGSDRSEVLFLALTRPTLKWGVPVEGLSLNAAVTGIGGMFWSMHPTGGTLTHNIVYSPFIVWLLFFPIHWAMRYIVTLDYHGFRTIRLWCETLTVVFNGTLQNLPTFRPASGKDYGSSV